MMKYAPNLAPPLLKLRKKCTHSKWGGIKKHPNPDKWIVELLGNDTDKLDLSSKMEGLDVITRLLNNLTEESEIILIGTDRELVLSNKDSNKLKIC